MAGGGNTLAPSKPIVKRKNLRTKNCCVSEESSDTQQSFCRAFSRPSNRFVLPFEPFDLYANLSACACAIARVRLFTPSL